MNDDLWSIIKSEDVRKGLKEKFKPSALWWKNTIQSSYISIDEKIAHLENLLEIYDVDEKEDILISNAIIYYTNGLKYLTRNYDNIICTMTTYAGSSIDNICGNILTVNNYKFTEQAIEDVKDGCVYIIEVNLVFKHEIVYAGKLWVGYGEKPFIYDIYLSDIACHVCGLHMREKEEVEDNNVLYDRHPYPFKEGERIKYQTPIMDKPIFGKFVSELDDNGCWYHFFEGENGEYADFSYPRIDLTKCFSTLDWVSVA